MIANELRRFFLEEDGTETIEWALVALILLALVTPAAIEVGKRLRDILEKMLLALGE